MDKKIISSIIAAAAIISTIGCSKQEGPESVSTPLSLRAEIVTATDSGTKATLLDHSSSISGYYVAGFVQGSNSKWFPGDAEKQKVTSSQASFDSYLWKEKSSYTFYAYSDNIPSSGITAGISSTGASLNVTSLPADASDQKDILLGIYSGDGSIGGVKSGTASIHFYHPMATLQLTAGSIIGLNSITSIEIQGLYSQGSTTLDSSNTVTGTGDQRVAQFQWQSLGGSLKATQACSVSSLTEDSPIGEPFILIPQAFSGNVKVALSVKLSDGTSTRIKGSLNEGGLVAGKKTICEINYSGGDKITFSPVSVTAWGSNEGREANAEEKN